MAALAGHRPSHLFVPVAGQPAAGHPFASSRCAAPPAAVLVRWTPPRPGWFKLNFDGSVFHDGSGRASIGGAVRNSAGRVVLAFAERTEHAEVGVVEARALMRGLRLTLHEGCRRLVVEGDDLTLVRLLRRESPASRIPPEMEDEMLQLLECFDGVELRHVYREGNQVAHTLCRQAYKREQVWTTAGPMVPLAVWEKVEDDRYGVAHQRILRHG